MKKTLTFLLRLFIGILILGFLLYKLDFSEIYKAFLKIKLYVIFLIILYTFIIIFMNTLILKIQLNLINEKINFPNLFKYYSRAWSLGRFLPGRLGELSLIYFLRKRDVPIGKGASVTILSKLIQFITLVMISIFGFFLFLSTQAAIKLSLFFVALIFVVCFFLFSGGARGVIKKYILRKYSSKFKGFSKSLFDIIKNKKVLTASFLLNFTRSIIGAILISAVFLSFGTSVPFTMILIINSIGVLVALIPISTAGLGTREVAIVYLYSQLGISAIIAGSIYLLIRLIGYLIAGGILIFSKK